MKKNKIRTYIATGFTVFNLILLIPLVLLAYIAPMGLADSSYQRTAIVLIIITVLTPLSVPFGIYKGWKNLENSSLATFLFYQLLPLLSIGLIYLLCTISGYLLI
jgi:hypothetical protein